ncbi:sugar ABC transporter ATP-binding protein, partial [Streptomyces carpinensis]
MTDNLTFDSHERAEMQGTSPRLAVSGISKRYGVVQALDDVSFDVSAGQIHALVGENGSGKSTVVGIISGTVQPDAGVISIDGGAVTSRRTADSQRAGAITVFQDGSLIKDLSVAQNLYLGTDRAQRPAYRRIVAWATELLASHGIRIDPTMKAGDLAPGDRQLLEIIRAISREPKILILDEATSALDAQGVDTVLLLMRQVASRGTAVLFVTHRLSEVERVADTVTVLRDGRYQGTHDAPTTALQRLVELMAGTRVDMEFPERSDQSNGKVLLQAKDLAGPGFGPVDVELRAGEIVGIAGADGNGQLALLRGLASLGETHGHVRTGGTSIRSYRMAVERGVVLLGSDRKNESLFSALSVGDNIGIGVLGRLSSMGFMRLKRERSFIEDSIEEYRIRVGNPRQLPSELSGGNQQKVALSRVLAMDPRVVLIDEPTQGVDVRSRMDIYRLLRQVADKGHAVVVVSSDASEL